MKLIVHKLLKIIFQFWCFLCTVTERETESSLFSLGVIYNILVIFYLPNMWFSEERCEFVTMAMTLFSLATSMQCFSSMWDFTEIWCKTVWFFKQTWILSRIWKFQKRLEKQQENNHGVLRFSFHNNISFLIPLALRKKFNKTQHQQTTAYIQSDLV